MKGENEGGLQNVLYFQILSPISIKPILKLCSCCGNLSQYKCKFCQSRFCSVKCKAIHLNKRCLKRDI
ncbi:hypothetical protein MXB_3178 [Myxobolus squamalis]|nr:hypothetical protein MXB_3178 [Myxobolus squamalis]